MAVIAAAVALLLLQFPTSAATPGGEKWTKEYSSPEPIGWRHPVALALAPNARCLAIAHAGTVTVFDISGAFLWSWNYAKASRYIEPAELAISSSCDAVALVGRPEYKYTWLVRRRGGARALSTISTPLGAAFDRRGEHLAVGTGGSDVHLFTIAGVQRWKTTLERGGFDRLAFSDDDRSVVLLGRGIGVLRVDGSVVWEADDNAMVASLDLRTFVSWSEPSHGPGIGGTFARGAGGELLWPAYKFSSTVGALVSRTGDRIAAWVNLNQNPTEADGFTQDHPRVLQVLGRAGDLIETIPAPQGQLLAFSPQADRVLLKTPDRLVEMDATGRVSFLILLNQHEESRVIVAEDYSGLLLLQGRGTTRIHWFELRPAK